MNEVKKSDIELIINALKDFLKQFNETKNFNLQEFFNLMEPKFIEAGYRKQVDVNSQGGGINKIYS